MRHDKRPKLLSQALSRPWVQTRVLRRDQGIATCLGEFWLTALRCAPKEPPPTQPPPKSSAVMLPSLGVHSRSGSRSGLGQSKSLRWGSADAAAETGLCREGYELLHGRLLTVLASDPRGAECVAAHSWDAEHPSPMPYMSRERFLDVLFELATELVPVTTGTSATMADEYIDWLLTLLGKVAVQAPMTETHKGTTVVGLFWKWRPEVKPAPEFVPGYVPPAAVDGGDDSVDGSGSSGGGGGGGGGGGRRKSKESAVGSFDQVAEEAAEETAEEEQEEETAEQEEAALEQNEAATVLQSRARAAHAQKEVALERERVRERRSVVPPSSPVMTPPVMMQEGTWMGSEGMGSAGNPTSEVGAAAAEVQAVRTPAAAEVAVKERIAKLDREAATGSLSQVERRERRASQDMLASLTQAQQEASQDMLASLTQAEQEVSRDMLASLTQAEQEASQDTFAALDAVQAASHPNPNPNAALEAVQAATRGHLARRALPSLKKTFLRERARLKGSNMSALIELVLEDQRDQLKQGASRHTLTFGLRDAGLLARADTADGNADGQGLAEGGGATGGGAAAEAQAVEVRISDLEQRQAAGELSEAERAELAASEANLRLLLERDAAKAEAEAVQSRVAELTHKQAAGELRVAEKAELNSSEPKLAALEATAAVGTNGGHARGPPPVAVSHAVGERSRHLGGYGGKQLHGGDAGSISNGPDSPLEAAYDLSPGVRRPGAPFLPWARAHSPTRSTAPQPHQPAATAAQPNACIRTAATSGPAYAPHVPPAYPRPLLQPHATTDGSVSWFDVGPRLEQMRSNSMPLNSMPLNSMPLNSMPLNSSMPRASSLTLIPGAHARDDRVLIMRRDGCGTGMGSGTGMSGGAGMGGNTGSESGGGMGVVVRLTSASGGAYSLGTFPRLGLASRGLQRGEAAVQFSPKPSPPPLTSLSSSIGGGAETVSIAAIQKALAKVASAEQEASPVAASPSPILYAPPPSPQQSQRRSSHRRSSQMSISHPPSGPRQRESHQRPFSEVDARLLTHHAALEASRAFASRDGIGGVSARGGVRARDGASRAVLQLPSQSLQLPVPVLPGELLPLPSPGSGNAEQQLRQLTEPFRGVAAADALLHKPWPLPPMPAGGISHAPLAQVGGASAPSSPLPLKTSFSAATLSQEGVVVIRVPAHGGSMMSAAIVVNEGVATFLKGGWVVAPIPPIQNAAESPMAHPQLSLHALRRQVRDEPPPAHLLRSGSGKQCSPPGGCGKQGSPPGGSDPAAQRMRRQIEHAGGGAPAKSPLVSPSSPPRGQTSFGAATLSKEGFVPEPVQAQGASAARAATSSNEFGSAVAPSESYDTPSNAQGTSAAVALRVSPSTPWSTPRRSVETQPDDPSEQITPWERREVHTPGISTRATARAGS
jgi:hypothetical protein